MVKKIHDNTHKKTLEGAKVFILILSNLLNGFAKFDANIGNT